MENKKNDGYNFSTIFVFMVFGVILFILTLNYFAKDNYGRETRDEWMEERKTADSLFYSIEFSGVVKDVKVITIYSPRRKIKILNLERIPGTIIIYSPPTRFFDFKNPYHTFMRISGDLFNKIQPGDTMKKDSGSMEINVQTKNGEKITETFRSKFL